MQKIIFLALIICCNVCFSQPLISDSSLNEISGIIPSINNKNCFWMHNDSGDTSRIFLVDAGGKLKGIYGWHEKVIDCEDIAMNPNEKGRAFVYVGDIGDNGARRPFISLYRFAEPVNRNGSSQTIEQVEKINLKYPEGPRDAETLLIDPLEQQIVIVTKREDTVGIYACAIPANARDTITLQRKAGLYLPGKGNPKWVVAGDISNDGRQVILKTYTNVYYWKRKAGEAVWQTLQRSFTALPYQPEPQGEAICFDHTRKGYVSVSEGLKQPLYHYNIPKENVKQQAIRPAVLSE